MSMNTNDPIRNESEAIEENENENESIRDVDQNIPKRRQSRVISSNNKVKENRSHFQGKFILSIG